MENNGEKKALHLQSPSVYNYMYSPMIVSMCLSEETEGYLHPAGDVLWVFVEPGNVVP